jgi:hypothetical protein
VGWFDLHARGYRRIPVDEQCEVRSIVGYIATGDDAKPSLHLHIVLGLRDGTLAGPSAERGGPPDSGGDDREGGDPPKAENLGLRLLIYDHAGDQPGPSS